DQEAAVLEGCPPGRATVRHRRPLLRLSGQPDLDRDRKDLGLAAHGIAPWQEDTEHALALPIQQAPKLLVIPAPAGQLLLLGSLGTGQLRDALLGIEERALALLRRQLLDLPLEPGQALLLDQVRQFTLATLEPLPFALHGARVLGLDGCAQLARELI